MGLGAKRFGRKRVRRAGSVFFLATLVGGIASLGLAIGSGSWRIDPILSGSMRPGFPVGGVVVAERVPVAVLRVYDVVLFQPPWSPGTTDVHRIVQIHRHGLITTIRTKGDDNSVADPLPVRLTGRWIYEARFALPLVGYAAVWLHSPAGELELAGVLLCVAIGVAAWATHERRALSERIGAQVWPEMPDSTVHGDDGEPVVRL